MEGTVIDSSPQLNYHYNMPSNDANKILGLPVIYKDYIEDIIMFQQVFDKRKSSAVDSDDLSPLTNTIALRFSFTKKTFAFKYFTFLDLFSDLGGVGSAITAII